MNDPYPDRCYIADLKYACGLDMEMDDECNSCDTHGRLEGGQDCRYYRPVGKMGRKQE